MAKLGDQMRKIARIKKGADPLLMSEVTYDPEEVELKKLFEMADFFNKTVLEVGCGVGRITTRISKIAKEVYAIDVNEAVLEVAKRKALAQKLHNIKFYRVSADEIRFPSNFFDVVLCSWCLHHISRKHETLRQIKKVLKRDGYLVIIEGSSKNDYVRLSSRVKPNEAKRIEEKTARIFRLAKKQFSLLKKVHFVTFYTIKSRASTLNLLDVYKVPLDRIDRKVLDKFLDKRKTDGGYKLSESGYIGIFKKRLKKRS